MRLCRIYAEKQGWNVSTSYHDRAVSGASRTIVRALIEEHVLAGLTDSLVSPEAMAEAVRGEFPEAL